MIHISTPQFKTRFVTLVLKGNGLPLKQEDRHVLMLSAFLTLGGGRQYSEPELNELLRNWSDRFGDNVCLDHVSLRRLLVDEKYLTRDAAGKTYVAKETDLPCTFKPEIQSLDLQELVDDALREQEERRRLHRQGDGQ